MEHGDTKPYFIEVYNKYNKANFFCNRELFRFV